MSRITQINKIAILLNVGHKQVLYLKLDKNGGIHRLGDGNANTREKDLYMGITKGVIFYQVISKIDDFILDSCGHSYTVENKKGATCHLTLLFEIDGKETGLEVTYGELSQGPPRSVVEYITAAVRLTDSWFYEQKKLNTKWWQIWK